jgi:hypothetical protein
MQLRAFSRVYYRYISKRYPSNADSSQWHCNVGRLRAIMCGVDHVHDWMYRQMIWKLQSLDILSHQFLDVKRAISLGCQLIRRLCTRVGIREQSLVDSNLITHFILVL